MAAAVWDSEGNRVTPEGVQMVAEPIVFEPLSSEEVLALDPMAAMQQEIDELKAALLAVQSYGPGPGQMELM